MNPLSPSPNRAGALRLLWSMTDLVGQDVADGQPMSASGRHLTGSGGPRALCVHPASSPPGTFSPAGSTESAGQTMAPLSVDAPVDGIDQMDHVGHESGQAVVLCGAPERLGARPDVVTGSHGRSGVTEAVICRPTSRAGSGFRPTAENLAEHPLHSHSSARRPTRVCRRAYVHAKAVL